MTKLTQQETELFLENKKTFSDFPRGAQVHFDPDNQPIQFGTVIGHQLNSFGGMLLVVSVVGVDRELTTVLHPKRAVRISK